MISRAIQSQHISGQEMYAEHAINSHSSRVDKLTELGWLQNSSPERAKIVQEYMDDSGYEKLDPALQQMDDEERVIQDKTHRSMYNNALTTEQNIKEIYQYNAFGLLAGKGVGDVLSSSYSQFSNTLTKSVPFRISLSIAGQFYGEYHGRCRVYQHTKEVHDRGTSQLDISRLERLNQKIDQLEALKAGSPRKDVHDPFDWSQRYRAQEHFKSVVNRYEH